MSNNFCPHLTFRLSFRYDRQNSLSIGDCVDQNSIHSAAGQEDVACSSPPPPSCVSNGKEGGGGDGICENGLDEKDCEKVEDDSNLPMLIDDVQPSLCDMCESSPSPAQWRCLDHRCGLVLCGTQASNHSQYHFDVS